jgi:pyruvate dehydrogenase E1 component alpha subunit
MDPIVLFAEHLQQHAGVSQADLDAIRQQVNQEIDAAVQFADESPPPPPEVLYEDIYVAVEQPQPEPVGAAR